MLRPRKVPELPRMKRQAQGTRAIYLLWIPFDSWRVYCAPPAHLPAAHASSLATQDLGLPRIKPLRSPYLSVFADNEMFASL